MISAQIIGLFILVFFFTLFQLPFLKHQQKKDISAYFLFTLIGLGLAILLIIKPDLPGPTQLIQKLYPTMIKKE